MFTITVKTMNKIRLKKLKNGYWYIWYEVNGKRNKISTKSKDENEANKFLAEFEIRLKERKNKNAFFDIDSIQKQLLNANREKSEKTLTAYKDLLKKFREFIPTWDKNENPDMFNAFVQSLFGKYSNSTIHGIQTKLHSLFLCAKELSLIPENTKFRKVTINRRTPPPLPLSQEDFDRIYNAIKIDIHKKILLFDFYTGLRISDIVSLKWTDIDFENRMIRKAQKKGKRPLCCPVFDIAYNILLELKQNPKSEYVFTNCSGTKFTTSGVWRAFHDAVVKVFGVNVYKFHSIRYGTAKKLSDMNLSLEFIKEMLGHESIQTTMWYVGANRDLLETGRAKANAILNESIKKQECLFQDMCMN